MWEVAVWKWWQREDIFLNTCFFIRGHTSWPTRIVILSPVFWNFVTVLIDNARHQHVHFHVSLGFATLLPRLMFAFIFDFLFLLFLGTIAPEMPLLFALPAHFQHSTWSIGVVNVAEKLLSLATTVGFSLEETGLYCYSSFFNFWPDCVASKDLYLLAG